MRGIARLVLPLLLVGCHGVGKLDPTTLGRGTWQRPADVVALLDLDEGDRVADLGAGDGYFVPYLAEAVGTDGRVYAVDVDSDSVGRLADAFPAESTNVEAVHAEANDPALPDGSIGIAGANISVGGNRSRTTRANPAMPVCWARADPIDTFGV